MKRFLLIQSLHIAAQRYLILCHPLGVSITRISDILDCMHEPLKCVNLTNHVMSRWRTIDYYAKSQEGAKIPEKKKDEK